MRIDLTNKTQTQQVFHAVYPGYAPGSSGTAAGAVASVTLAPGASKGWCFPPTTHGDGVDYGNNIYAGSSGANATLWEWSKKSASEPMWYDVSTVNGHNGMFQATITKTDGSACPSAGCPPFGFVCPQQYRNASGECVSPARDSNDPAVQAAWSGLFSGKGCSNLFSIPSGNSTAMVNGTNARCDSPAVVSLQFTNG